MCYTYTCLTFVIPVPPLCCSLRPIITSTSSSVSFLWLTTSSPHAFPFRSFPVLFFFPPFCACHSRSLNFLYFNCKPSPFHIGAFPFLLLPHLSCTLLLYLNFLAADPINCVDVIFGAVHSADDSVCERDTEKGGEREREGAASKKVRWK